MTTLLLLDLYANDYYTNTLDNTLSTTNYTDNENERWKGLK